MAATITARDAHQQFIGHRFYRYRGCAPDPDQPTQAAGDPDLPWRAWEAPDVDGGEDQAARLRREAAAKAVCARCPVQQACLTYGTSTNDEGRIAVEHGIFGGATMLERHRMFIRQRQATLDEEQAAAADRRLRTAQKLAVLRALAAHTDPYEVAAAAGVDVRTANWQRSACCTLLGLDKLVATRGQLLAAAQERGLLDGVTIASGGEDVPAVPPPGTTPVAATSPATAPVAAVPAPPQTAVPRHTPSAAAPARDETPPARGRRIPAPHRGRFHAIRGQLSLDQALTEHRHLRLVPNRPRILGAAA
ncbi:WhiB family transcriptional regulator [Streptomyces sp. NPDC054847]